MTDAPASPAPTSPADTGPYAVPVAEVVRSGFVESVHHGVVVALDADGSVLLERGNPSAPIFPRSAVKPIQAVAMLRHGLDLDGELLALVSSSHSGEAFHLDGARRILAAAGLSESDLQNTPGLPIDPVERDAWVAAGRPASSIAADCSGKHAGMLSTCVAAGWDLATYRDPRHPLQQAIAESLTELAGEPISATGVDGCGAPVFAVPLTGLARAFGRLATAAIGTPEGRVRDAIRAHPQWLGGTRRDVTTLIRGVDGLVSKDGAEAVQAVGLADGRCLAVKILDGGSRARAVVTASALRALGLDDDVLSTMQSAPVLGHGEPVGALTATGF